MIFVPPVAGTEPGNVAGPLDPRFATLAAGVTVAQAATEAAVADITALAAELADMGATVDAKLAALNAPPQVVRLPVSGTLALTPASGVRVHAVMLVQDPVGGRTVTWPSTVVWDGGTPPTLSTAPGAVDRVILQSWGEDGQWLASLTGRFSVPTPDVVVTPTAPTFLDASGTAGDTYTIPACTGVTYFVGISEKAAGTYAGAGTVTVTAQAKLGYALQGTTTWAWTYSTSNDPVLWAEDDFTAADGTLIPGRVTPTGGKTWAAKTPAQYDHAYISGNAATFVRTSGHYDATDTLVLPLPVGTGAIAVEVDYGAGGFGVVIPWAESGNNRECFFNLPSGRTMTVNSAGWNPFVLTSGTLTGFPTTGTLRIVANGSTVKIYSNGVEKAAGTLPQGVHQGAGAQFFMEHLTTIDRFRVEAA